MYDKCCETCAYKLIMGDNVIIGKMIILITGVSSLYPLTIMRSYVYYSTHMLYQPVFIML